MRRQPDLSAVSVAAAASTQSTHPARVSAIVPIGPGDRTWPGLVAELAGMQPRPEIVLVFSADDPQRADAPGDVLALAATTGRAHQLNAGMSAACGDWLWLLHADSRFRGDTVPALERWLSVAPVALGWFRLGFSRGGPWPMPLNACGANLRARWLGLPFGDQGFIVRREDARRLGPFDTTLYSGEDHAWVWQARRLGLPVRPVGGTLATSARKYAEQGWLRTTLRHLLLTWRQARRESRP